MTLTYWSTGLRVPDMWMAPFIERMNWITSYGSIHAAWMDSPFSSALTDLMYLSSLARNHFFRPSPRVVSSEILFSPLSTSSSVLSSPNCIMFSMTMDNCSMFRPNFLLILRVSSSAGIRDSLLSIDNLSFAMDLMIIFSSPMNSPRVMVSNTLGSVFIVDTSSFAASISLIGMVKLSCCLAASTMLCASSTIITRLEPSDSMFPRKLSLMSSDRTCTYGATTTSMSLISIFLASYGQAPNLSQYMSKSAETGMFFLQYASMSLRRNFMAEKNLHPPAPSLAFFLPSSQRLERTEGGMFS